MTCPKCGNEYSGGRCGICGYDRSADCLRYPTLTPVSAAQAASADPEEERLRSMYETALAVEQAASTEAGFSAAALLYEQMGKPGWRDSAQRARRCREMARRLEQAAQPRQETGGAPAPQPGPPPLKAPGVTQDPAPQPAPQPVTPRRPGKGGGKKKVLLGSLLGVVALAAAALLLWKVILPGRDGGTSSPGSKGSSVSAHTEKPDSTEAPTPTRDPEPSSEPAATAQPTAGPAGGSSRKGWLDLSGYPELEVVPDEDSIFDDYVYFAVQVAASLNMRSGPGSSYDRIGEIPDRSLVGAVANNADGDWSLVSYDGKFGWVRTDYLTSDLSYASESVPTPEPTPVSSAADPEAADKFTYETDSDGNATITGYTGSKTELVIPAALDGHPVTAIGENAFDHCVDLTGVTLPESLTCIAERAFYFCKGLTVMMIPTGVTEIGAYAFHGCSALQEFRVSAGNACYSALDGVLFDRDKTELVRYPAGKVTGGYSIPESVVRLSGDAFVGCDGLTDVTIPAGLTEIGPYAFNFSDSLREFRVSPGNPNYSTLDGVLFDRDKTGLLRYPEGKESDNYSIPDGVTYIWWCAFCSCDNLTSVTIPESVTVIGVQAFINSGGLMDITIPESVTELGAGAFMNCRGLLNAKIPEGILNISGDLFNNCVGLTSITIPKSVTSIGGGAFADCSALTDVYYGGTREQWNAVAIAENNSGLEEAEIRFGE